MIPKVLFTFSKFNLKLIFDILVDVRGLFPYVFDKRVQYINSNIRYH